MRSSKKRSRSNQNRPRSLGNIVNRVFDSSGPEGKVRGTPQQIIEKYQALARDAQLSNDRVAAENFLQHAEHYTRMLAEAQRELAAEQEARQQHYQQNPHRERNDFRDRNGERGDYRPTGTEDQPVIGEPPEFAGEYAALVDLPEASQPEMDHAQREPRQDNRQRNDRNNDRNNDRRYPPRRERDDRYQDRNNDRRQQQPRREAEPVAEQPVIVAEAPAVVEVAVAPVVAPVEKPVAVEAKVEAEKPVVRRPRKPKVEVAAGEEAAAPEAKPRRARAPKAE